MTSVQKKENIRYLQASTSCLTSILLLVHVFIYLLLYCICHKQPLLLSLSEVVKLTLLAGLTRITKMSMYLNNQYALFTRCPFCMVTSKLPLSMYLPWSSMTHAPFFCSSCISQHSLKHFPLCSCLWCSLKVAWGCTHPPLPTLNQSSFSCLI